jgi:hypothetical protein
MKGSAGSASEGAGRFKSILDPSPRACRAVLFAGWLVATGLLVWLHRDLTFAVDEFDFSETVGAGSVEEFLAPQNGHLLVTPFLVFRLLYMAFGTTLVPFTLLEGAMLAVLSAGLFVYSRARVGPLLALLPALLPLFLGTAWPLLMPPMIGLLWIFAIATGVWALVLLEGETRLGDIAACGLLCVAVSSFSLGLVFVLACALAIFLSPRRWRRIFVVAIPAVIWICWYVWARKFGGIATHPSYLLLLPAYAVDSIAANTAALLGRPLPYSPATSLYLDGFSFHRLVFALGLAAIEAVACLLVISKFGFARLNRRSLWIVLVIPLAWWASQVIVLETFRTPSANRYFFAGVVILLLVVVEVARGIRVRPSLAILIYAVAAVALVANLLAFRDGRTALVALSLEAKANMAMMDLEGRKGDQAYVPSSEPLTPESQFMFLTVGPYLDVAERFGSPADTLSEVEAAPEPIREGADTISARLLLLHLSSATGHSRRRDCRSVAATANSHRIVVRLPRGGATLGSKAPRTLYVGRFADGYPVRVGRLSGFSASRLEIPSDHSRRPWRAMATGAAPLLVCRL